MVLPLEKEKNFSSRQIINPETLKIKWMFNTSSNNSLASSVSPFHGKWIKGKAADKPILIILRKESS